MKYKYLFLLFLVWFLLLTINTIQAKNPNSVTITAPSLTNLCPNATDYVNLNDIEITEGINTDIALGSSQTIVLNMPTGIELKSGVGTLDLGLAADNLGGGFIFVSSNAIFITFNANAGSETKLNTIKITGLQVRANSAVVGTVNMTYNVGSTASILGLNAGATMASFSTATLPAIPIITNGNTQKFCVGTSTSTAIAVTGSGTVRWYSDINLTTELAVSPSNSLTLNNLGISTTTTSNHTFYLVNDNVCKSNIVALTINIVALPTVNVTNNGTSICIGKQITFIASGNSIEYYFEIKQGATSIAIQNYSTNTSYTTLSSLLVGSYTMEVFGKNANDCISLINTTNFTINSLPTIPTITNGNAQNFCVGMDASITNIAATGSGTIHWYSDINLTNLLTSGNNPTLSSLLISTIGVTTYTIYVVNDNGTCKSNPVVFVANIVPIPTMAVINSGTSICRGKTTTFTATGTSTYRFQLLQGVTSIDIQDYSTANTYTTSPTLLAGSYTLRAWGRDVNTCISTLSTTNFTINTLPTVPILTNGNSQNFCGGTATSTIVQATGSGTIRWFDDVALTSPVSSLSSPTLNNLGIVSTTFPNVYTFYVVNDNGACYSNTVVVTITIEQSPIVSVTSSDGNNRVCEGKTITFTATGNSIQYRIDLRKSGVSEPGFPTPFAATNTYTTSTGLLADNNYSVVVTGRLANGCTTVSSPINFEVKPNPTVTFTWPSGTTSYVNTDSNPVNLASAGAPAGGVFSGNGISGNIFTPSSAGVGSHLINYTYSDINNCQVTKSVLVSITTGGFIIPQAFCEGDSPTSPLVNGSCTTGSVTSNFGSPAAAIINAGANDFRFNPSAITIPTGQNFFKWEGSMFFNPDSGPFFPCPNYGFYIFTYVFRKPNPIISGNFAVCENTINAVYSVPAVAGNAYNWSITGGTISSGQGTNSITVNWGVSGVGNIQITQIANYNTPISYSCGKTVNQNISIIAPPSPNIIPILGGVCENTQATYSVSFSASSTYSWSVTGGTIAGSTLGLGSFVAGSNTGNSVVINWGAAGVNRSVSVTQSNPCSDTDTRSINVRSVPSLSIMGNINVCQNQNNVTYSVSNSLLPSSIGNNFQWTVTGGAIIGSSTSNSIVVNWGNAGVGTVKVTQEALYAASLTCSNNTSINVTINSLPNTTVLVGTGTLCENTSNNNFYTTNTLGHTYLWSVVGGTIASGQGTSSIFVNWSGAGAGSISLTQTNINGCSQTSFNPFTISAKPNPSVNSSTPPIICSNTNGVIYNTNNIVGNSYLWTIVGGTIISGANTNQVTVNWGSANPSASITLEETSSTGCIATSTRNINLTPLPNPSITGTVNVCAISTGIIYTTSGIGNFIWSVTGGVITAGQNTNQITVTWGVAGTGNVSVTNTDPLGCIGNASQNITINALPMPTITGANQVCAGKTGEIYSVSSTVGHSYLWIVSGGAINGSNTSNFITVDWGNGNVGSVQVVQTNTTTNCNRTSITPITINPLPNPTISGNLNVCTQSIQNYSVLNGAGQSFNWVVTGGTINSGQGTNTIQVTWGTAGGGNVSITQTNTLLTPNCSRNVNAIISILPLPNLIITGNVSVCEFDNTIQYSVNAVTNNTYLWSVTGGTITIGQGSDRIWVNWGANGTGIISITQTDVSSCVRTTSQNIAINPLPTPIISQDSGSLCENTLGNTFSVPNNIGRNYNWTVVGGSITSGQGSNIVTISWGASTNIASISVTEIISATGCSKNTTNNLIIIPKPTPSIVLSSSSVCANQTNTIYSTVLVAGNSYVWTVSGGTIIAGQNTNQITVDWGIANPIASISVVETAVNGCTQNASRNIVVNPLPTPNIIGNTTVCAFESVGAFGNIFTYTTSLVSGHFYNWTIGSNGTILTGQGSNSITVRWANQSTAYTNTLRVTETNNSMPGCVVFHDINVNVKPVPVTDVLIQNLCLGDITTFSLTATNTSGWSFNWSIPSDNFSSFSANPTITFANVGLKTLNLVVTNSDNCQYQITKTFRINPVPVANFNYTGTCLPNITTFNDASTVNSSVSNDIIVTRIWNFGDGSPILSGNNTNPTHSYTTMGKYNVSLTVQTNNGCNNTFTQEIVLFPSFSPNDATAYFESFENNNHGWVAGSYNPLAIDTWAIGVPNNRNIQSTTGKVWTTGLNANYTNSQRSYVESPCFNLQGLSRPMLTLKKWSDSEKDLDGTVILYTTDFGNNWKVLGDMNAGLNWYSADNIVSSPGPIEVNTLRLGWTGKDNEWKDARFALDNVKAEAGANSVRFRIAFSSNADNLSGTWDGFAFDDVSITNRDGKVLLEHFTNMASTTENDFVNNFPPEAIKLQYQTNFLNDNDKLYQENKADGGARALTYGISTAPRGAMNGKPNFNDAFSVWGTSTYLQNSLNSPKFNVNITFPTLPNDKLNISVQIKANQNYNKPVVVHIVLIEKNVTSTQLGLSGTTIYRNIVRKMLPSAGGTTYYGNWALNDIQNFSQSITIYSVTQENNPKFYDWNNLSVVAFVQDYETLEVFQSDEKSPTTLPSLISSIDNELQKQCWIYPNPTSDEVFIGFKEITNKKYDWEIYNMQGIKMNSGVILEDEKGIRIDVSQYAKGMYIVKIIEPQQKSIWQSKLQIR